MTEQEFTHLELLCDIWGRYNLLLRGGYYLSDNERAYIEREMNDVSEEINEYEGGDR